MLEDATPDTFRPHLGTPFAIEVQGGEPLLLTLEEVQVHGPGYDRRAESFSLLFGGPPDRMAPQATLRLTHDVLGDFDLFLVPIERGRYEAVFS